MARERGRKSSTSWTGDVPPPGDRRQETDCPGADSREVLKRRAEQKAAHIRKTLAALEEAAEKAWSFQSRAEADIRLGRGSEHSARAEPQPQRLPDNVAAYRHQAQQSGASSSPRIGRTNGHVESSSGGVDPRRGSGAPSASTQVGLSRRSRQGGQQRALYDIKSPFVKPR